MVEERMLNIAVEFTGGLEEYFSQKRKHNLLVPVTCHDGAPFTITNLIEYLCEHVMSEKERMDVFVLDGTVRPGILVLINDADWELEGEGSYKLQDGDEVVFVSTLHGG